MRFVQGEGGRGGGGEEDVADALTEEVTSREVHASGGDTVTDLKTTAEQ
jgi:hypothetical protein